MLDDERGFEGLPGSRVRARRSVVIPVSAAYGVRFAHKSPSPCSKSFKQDDHIPDLLAFHPSVRFIEDPLYLSGKIILQDKASCFPAHILAPPARNDAVVIDATAAPGNKTSHLCAIMQNKGKVSLAFGIYPQVAIHGTICDLTQLYAFERDRKRFSTLKTMLSKAHCTNVEAVNSDFLTVSPNDTNFGRATHMYVSIRPST